MSDPRNVYVDTEDASAPETPETGLLKAILEQALRDARSGNPEYREDLMSFVEGDHCRWICEEVGLSHAKYRAGLLELLKRAAPPPVKPPSARNLRIVDLAAQGRTVSEISAEVSLSRAMVSRIVQQHRVQ